jgi:hypothetical protein
MPLRAIQAAPPDQQAGGVDLGGHVGQLEGDGLLGGDGLAELDPLAGVVAGELEGGPGDADGLGADDRAGRLEGGQGARAARERG